MDCKKSTKTPAKNFSEVYTKEGNQKNGKEKKQEYAKTLHKQMRTDVRVKRMQPSKHMCEKTRDGGLLREKA